MRLGPERTSELRRFTRSRLGVTGGVIIVLLILAALGAPVVATHDPNVTNVRQASQPPSMSAWMGTDDLGRDVFSRTVFGARISLLVGLAAATCGTLVGSVIGLASGQARGGVDAGVQWLVDMLLGFPPLLLAMLVTSLLGPSAQNVILGIAVPIIPVAARVARAAGLAVSSKEFIVAAAASGCSSQRILTRHIFPNAAAPCIVILTSQIGWAILSESTLGFIGLGVPPPTATWGQMLSGSLAAFSTAPWRVIFPGLAIGAAVFAFNVFGDALRDFWDPRLREM